MNVEKPSEEAVLMYVSALKQAFPDMPPPHRKKVRGRGEGRRGEGGGEEGGRREGEGKEEERGLEFEII